MSFDIQSASVQSNLNQIRKLKDHIQRKCEQLNDQPVGQELQDEISRLVLLLPRIEKILLKTIPGNTVWERMPKPITPDRREHIRVELNILVDFLQIAIDSLFQDIPNIELSKRIRISIERVIYRYEHPILGVLINRFMDAQRSPSTPIKVISGLLAALLINGVVTLPIVGLFIYYEASSITERELRDITTQIAEVNALLQRASSLINNMIPSPSTQTPAAPAQTTVPESQRLTVSGAIGQALDPETIRQNREIRNLQELLTALQKQQDALQRQQEVLQKQQQLEQGNIRVVLQIVLVISAGTLGSIVSILIRIEEFQDKPYADPLIPFLVGAFKPIIGAAFGLLFFALISSEIVIVQPLAEQTDNNRGFFIFAVAFIVGFSERLARDTIERTEGFFGGSLTPLSSRLPIASSTAVIVDKSKESKHYHQEASTVESADSESAPSAEERQ